MFISGDSGVDEQEVDLSNDKSVDDFLLGKRKKGEKINI